MSEIKENIKITSSQGNDILLSQLVGCVDLSNDNTSIIKES
jgi:hypothetical protein